MGESDNNFEVGNRIRALRKIRGISLKQMADDTGMSYSYLSGLENGKHSVTLTNLQRLSRYFDVDLVYFIQKDEPGSKVIRKADYPDADSLKDVYYDLVTSADAKDLQVSYICMPPNAPKEKYVHRHAQGHELVLVLEGSVTVMIGEDRQVLGPGDSVIFESNTEHLIFTENQSAVIVLISSPPYSGRQI